VLNKIPQQLPRIPKILRTKRKRIKLTITQKLSTVKVMRIILGMLT